MTRVLITGVTGQDGSYLAEHLLALGGYEVHGMIRPSSRPAFVERATKGAVKFWIGDVTDFGSVRRVIDAVRPDHVYNLADQDHVGKSVACPALAVTTTYGGAVNVFEAALAVNPEIRVFQPCSATMYGLQDKPITKGTPLSPQSPYAVAKTAAYHAALYYRTRGLDVRAAVLWGHDSPRRIGREYLLQKIARMAMEVRRGNPQTMAGPDRWICIGHAREFVEKFVALMKEDKPSLTTFIGSGFSYPISMLARDYRIRWGAPFEELFGAGTGSCPDKSETEYVTTINHRQVVDEIIEELEKSS